MASTVINHKFNGQPFDAISDIKGATISAVFGLSTQPVLNLDLLTVHNTDKYLTSDLLRQAQIDNPVEGGIYSFEITDGTISQEFDFLLDYTRFKILSDVTTQVGLVKDGSLDSLIDYSGADITMSLLDFNGTLLPTDYANVPYVVHNRKTILERLQLLYQFFVIFKSGLDEIFKFVNIAADIVSGVIAAPLALANLTTTIASLVLIIQKISDLVGQIHESFWPPTLYHSGIKLKKFLTRGCEFLGYDVEFGTEWEEIDEITLCPSKNDEIGTLIPLPLAFTPGILKPQDFGHNLKDAFELARKLGNVDVGIIGNTVHIRPRKDPFWILNSSFILPPVLIEDTIFTKNGTQRFNYEELHAAITTEYVTDDSDYWTIQAQAEAGTSGDRISVTTVTPISVGVQRRVKVGTVKTNTIPYALCVRKDTFDDLIDFFLDMSDSFDAFKVAVESQYDSVGDFLTETFPVLAVLDSFTYNRDGAMKVENHFFSTPKIVLLEDNFKGEPRIPEDFNDKIGAKALYDKYFAYDSLVQGVRDPANLDDTNAKRIYEGVTIDFTLKNFIEVINNSYFSSTELGVGKIIKLDWHIDEDKADIDFWVYENWLKNVEENQV